MENGVFSHYDDEVFVLFGEIIFISVQSYRTHKCDVLPDVVSLKTTTDATYVCMVFQG